jgi:maltooligosyltrehalose trehalohydrolase
MGKSHIPGARFISENTCEFVVWAPFANSVQLIITEPSPKILSLCEESSSYWRIKIEDCMAGVRYFYKIDDRSPLPDPASLSQPLGVSGASEVVRLNTIKWDDQKWKNIPLEEMLIYELHVGTFTDKGTFEGVISRLDYLSDLGINVIELMPVAQFSGLHNWGYDGVYPYAVQNTYGGALELI